MKVKDIGLTGDCARVLRVPDTLNYKYTPARRARVLDQYSTLERHDFPVVFAKLLEIAPPTSKATRKPLNFGPVADAFKQLLLKPLGAGIETLWPPLPFEPIGCECAWLREAYETGGKAFDNPQWNLTTLCAVFLEDGNALAHKFGEKHPDYDYGKTEAEWERKNREHDIKGIGWPSCKAIKDNGSVHCASCPHFAAGKSPLNLAPPQPPPAEPAPDAWDPADLRVSFSNIRHRQWVYGTYLLRGEVTMLAAPGGVGKTALATSWAVEIATSTELLDETIWGADLKVLSINGEDGKTEAERRVWAFTRAHGLKEQPPERLYVIGADDPRVQQMSLLQTNGRSNPSLNMAGFAVLESALDALHPDVLIIDPLVVFCGGVNMSDNAMMALVIRGLKILAVEYKCAVLVVHHTKKGGEPGDQESISGAAAIANLARRAIMPVPMTAGEATELGVLPCGRAPPCLLPHCRRSWCRR